MSQPTHRTLTKREARAWCRCLNLDGSRPSYDDALLVEEVLADADGRPIHLPGLGPAEEHPDMAEVWAALG